MKRLLIILLSLAFLVSSASAAVSIYNFTYGGNRIVVFNGTGTITWDNPNGSTSVTYLVVGGGGGAGYQAGGGGGGGGVLTGTLAISGSQVVIVGGGGAHSSVGGVKGTNGGVSNFSTIQSSGGGGGGSVSLESGANGASGGGARSNSGSAVGGTGIAGQGYAGGGTTITTGAGGGGGGAEVGANGLASYIGGKGGNGTLSSITGTSWFYGSGGGGGSNKASPGGAYGGNKTAGGGQTDVLVEIGGAGENGYGGGGGGGGDDHAGGDGGSGTVIISYPIGASPQVSFTSNVTSGMEPLAVQFNDTSITSPTGWNWSFTNVSPGNGTQVWWSTIQNATRIFGRGNHRINLNVTNSSGYNISTSNYWINVTPRILVSNFTCTPVNGTTSTTITCTDLSSAAGYYVPDNWTWVFGDGNSSTLQNPTKTYAANGVYDVNLTVYNASYGFSSWLRPSYITIDDSGGLNGWNRQDIIMDELNTLTITFKDAESEAIIPIVTVITNAGDNTTTSLGIFTHSYNYTVLVVTAGASGYYSNQASYIIDDDRSEVILLTRIPTTQAPAVHQVSYVAHLVRLRAINYAGNGISDLNVSAVGIESTSPYSWITDILGIDITETNVQNTTMTGQTGNDGAIVFLMVENIEYEITFTKPSEGISETTHLYPKEDNYVYTFWTEAPTPSTSLIYPNVWNKTNGTDPNYMDLFATYYDTGTTTDNLTFRVVGAGNVTIYEKSSVTPNGWNISYPVLKERGATYAWSISGNTTRFPNRVGKTGFLAFGGSPVIPTDFGTFWNKWIALLFIFVISWLFGRASIKYAAASVALLTLFFVVIGFLGLSQMMIATIVFLGILFYMRYAEQESDL